MGEVQRFTNCTTGGPVFVDVKDDKIIRLTPLEFDDTDAPSWTIEARGQKFTPPRKALVSPWTIAHRSTVYSPKRILTPLKRVDFDPKGERNIQNRGTSGYEPISWDEAFDMVAEEIIRVKREYGPGAIYHPAQFPPDVGQRRLPLQLLPALPQRGGHDLHRAQPGQLGGLAVGRRPHVGQHPPPGEPRGLRPARGRAQEHRDDRVLVVRPRHHSGRGLRGLRVAAAAPLAQGPRA